MWTILRMAAQAMDMPFLPWASRAEGRNSGTPRIAPNGGNKEQKPCEPGVITCPSAQPVAQADAGCAFGFVAGLSRRAA